MKALNEEKKYRKHGKPLGLLDAEEPGKAQFWSSAEIAAAQLRVNEIENKKHEKIAQTEANKTQHTIRKEQKARELKERKAAREKT